MTQDALRFTSETNMISCLSPCVCLTPVAGAIVPIPYMIFSKLNWSKKTIENVTFGGEQAFTMDSRTNKVIGNEPGVKGGIISGVNRGWCRPQSNKSNFYVNGKQVIQHDCIFEMNCNGPDGPSNTIGKIMYYDK
ncbi:DUF4150 domain-containing protein [Bartonella sp. HY329]|uniref:DUF4150 domain-containing protein n=1 Tax=unclassified Bartonella TaxID=2645622 RepID=UPI0021C79782|nr:MULTISPECIES: DUF4150 domain-containing protein [unclassified Bartonella]UXM95246.1 DUF4150 domain-containing protein [Bartonella sp. HY329]UXN09570.1 DUF4150 domain-containing protein [Bartonella sp. HY328]